MRGKPEIIQPGDVVVIPKTGPGKKQLQSLVKSLEAQRAATIKELEDSCKAMKAAVCGHQGEIQKTNDRHLDGRDDCHDP